MELIFEIHNNYHNNEDVASIIQALSESTRDDNIQDLVLQLVNLYKTSTSDCARDAFIELFIKYNSRRTIKKFLQDIITKLNIDDIIHTSLDNLTRDITSRKICNIRQLINLQHFLYIVQNSRSIKEELLNKLFTLYYLIFQGFVCQTRSQFHDVPNTEDLMQLMNSILKQILAMFAKSESFKLLIKKQFGLQLINLSYEVLNCDNVGYDVKTKCGLILVHTLMIIQDEELDKFLHKDCPVLDLIINSTNEDWIQLKSCTYKNILDQESNKIIIYSAIFNVLHDKNLDVKVGDRDLVMVFYEELIESARRSTNIPQQIVEVSRILSMLVKHLTKIPNENLVRMFNLGLQFVWTHIEHFIDVVRSYTKIILEGLIHLAAFNTGQGFSSPCQMILDYIRATPGTHTVKLMAMEYVAKYYGCCFLLDKFPDLMNLLLCTLADENLKQMGGKTYAALMDKHFEEVEQDKWFTYWVQPILKLLKEDVVVNVEYQNILARCLKKSPLLLKQIFPDQNYYGTQESIALLKCLKLGNAGASDDDYWRGLIKKKKLDQFKVHQNDEIRITALSVIVETQKSTEFFLEWELDFLISYLKYNITSQVPNIRKQQITFYKHAFARYEASYNVILRHLKRDKKWECMKVYYESFLVSFTKMLISNLSRDANYPRRSSSLELLLIVKPLMQMDIWVKCWSKNDALNCQNILYDSFEANKKMAVKILRLLPTSLLDFDIDGTRNFVELCIQMAKSIKPSSTLSAAYMFQISWISPHFTDIMMGYLGGQCILNDPNFLILSVLTKILDGLSHNDFENTGTSEYGVILSLRYILENRNLKEYNEEYSVLLKNLTDLCLKIKGHIMPVVCNPSPEGYLPENSESITDESGKAQKVLVYAWRTMKEMTLLLAEIIRQTVKLEDSCELLHRDILITVANFFIQIFTESKHRGVFEQAFVGFSIICQSFWVSRCTNLNSLPKQWLKDVLSLCTGEKLSDKLCATRRSAGLPFLILSILTTDPSYDKILFHETIKSLLKCCENTCVENNEFRTHSLNVLRAIFRHNKLGELVSIYVGEALILCIAGFASPTWGVRNSSTLLYSALITRIFGVQRTQDSEDLTMKNRLTFRVFFMRYPNLYEFLLDKLAEECMKRNSLLLHPILMILARLYPSHIEEHNSKMDQYLQYVTKALANPVYRTRELAARASVPLIPTDQIVPTIHSCFEILTSEENNNKCHGHLMQVLHLLKSHKKIPIECNMEKIMNIFKIGSKFSQHSFLLYLEVLLHILYRDTRTEPVLLEKFLDHVDNLSGTINSKMQRLQEVLLRLRAFIRLKILSDSTSFITQILKNFESSNKRMHQYCLYMLLSMNLSLSNGYKTRHPLIELEELVIPPEIIDLVENLPKNCLEMFLSQTHTYVAQFLAQIFKTVANNDNSILILLLTNYYPCVFKYKYADSLKHLFSVCETDNEQLISASISCITDILRSKDIKFQDFDVDELINILMQSASPAADDFRRITVCQFLLSNLEKMISTDLNVNNIIKLLNITMVLLEDEDSTVRNSLGQLTCTADNPLPQIPEVIKENIMHMSTKVLPKDMAINFLISWSCRHFPDSSLDDESEIFERGELNLFAENILIQEISKVLLQNLLLVDTPLDKDLKDRTTNVTRMLQESLTKYSLPMISYVTKQSLLQNLSQIEGILHDLDGSNDLVNLIMQICPEILIHCYHPILLL